MVTSGAPNACSCTHMLARARSSCYCGSWTPRSDASSRAPARFANGTVRRSSRAPRAPPPAAPGATPRRASSARSSSCRWSRERIRSRRRSAASAPRAGDGCAPNASPPRGGERSPAPRHTRAGGAGEIEDLEFGIRRHAVTLPGTGTAVITNSKFLIPNSPAPDPDRRSDPQRPRGRPRAAACRASRRRRAADRRCAPTATSAPAG